jgi:biotin synthase-related radical SAM superfamily protein
VKYVFIRQLRPQYGLAALCRVVGISRSSHYAATRRGLSLHSTEDLALRVHLRRVHQAVTSFDDILFQQLQLSHPEEIPGVRLIFRIAWASLN